EFGKESSVEPLVFALSDKHIRIEAARALGAIKSDRAVGALIGALKDEDRYFREEAIKALGEIKDRRAIKPLIDCLFDKEISVQKSAANSLVKIGKPACESLLEVLESDNIDAKMTAIYAIREIEDEHALQKLKELLENADENLKQIIELAIMKIEGKSK
ncbi:MAG: HEAT repeat domain-containing protein, partial [Thermoplasmata archaeon]